MPKPSPELCLCWELLIHMHTHTKCRGNGALGRAHHRGAPWEMAFPRGCATSGHKAETQMSEDLWIQPQGCCSQPPCLLQTAHGRVRAGFGEDMQQCFKGWRKCLAQTDLAQSAQSIGNREVASCNVCVSEKRGGLVPLKLHRERQ